MAMDSWSRSDKIALLSVFVALIACLAAIAVVPEVRSFVGLSIDRPGYEGPSPNRAGVNTSTTPLTDTKPTADIKPVTYGKPEAEPIAEPDSRIFGTYMTGNGNGTLQIIPSQGNKVDIKIYLPDDNCVAEVEGVGEVRGNKIEFSSGDVSSPCDLEIITSAPHKVNVVERNCLGWHGAGCGFDAALWK